MAEFGSHPLSKRSLEAWKVLSRHFSRCKHLELTFPQLDFLKIDDLSFPRLESLIEGEYQYLQDSTEDNMLWLTRAILEAPKLTQVSTWGIHRMYPFPQLARLELRYIIPDEFSVFLDVLPSCKRLESLILFSLDDSGMEPIAHEMVELPSLQELIIYGLEAVTLYKDNVILSTLLSSLSMPSLVTLRLDCEDWPPELLIVAERSPLLERVTLTFEITFVEDPLPLAPFLQSVGNLKNFELNTPWVSDVTSDSDEDIASDGPVQWSNKVLSTLLDDLRIRPNSPVPLPKLESLILRLSDITLNSEVVERVLEMVRERHSTSRPLLKELSLVRDTTCGSGTLFPYSEAVEKIREVESIFGVKVVIAEG
ncbi:hypothetical protein V5O48_009178 [Marasmius crinis-equi]|uniref:Uncharacterized protein n=1 Tax=Marasmius crinis-equi TaxID=585013 RepID=A0ABR3FBU7_9AGAR